MLPKFLTDECEKIDATFFSGDTFFEINNLNEIMTYVDRWKREGDKIRKVLGLMDIANQYKEDNKP